VDTAVVVDASDTSLLVVATLLAVGSLLAVTPTVDADVFATTSRANSKGCDAFGWMPTKTAVLSESGIFFSATTTKTMATSRSAMTVLMKGHRSAVGL
jgi:hypothetical protein